MNRSGTLPTPSDAVLVRLANIAVHAEELLAPDQPTAKARVGLTKAKNDRRRTMEALLVLLADPEVHGYVAKLEKLGILPIKG